MLSNRPFNGMKKHPVIPAPDYTALSHELRTPLAVISGYAQIMRDELGPEVEALTGPVVDQVQRLARIVDSVLETNELAAGRMRPTASSFHVMDLLSAVLDRHMEAARQKGLGMRVHMRLDTDNAWTDTERVAHALDNVLDNAIKFSESGTIDVHLESDDVSCCMTVIDDGPGFPESSDRLGAAFAQGSTGAARTHQGLGTGLFIARASMELIGGSLQFSNHPTGGAEVALEWPVTMPVESHLSLAA